MNISKSPKMPMRRRGTVVPLVAISMVVILSLAALSVDGGNLYRERRNTQIAADSAAEAAAIELLASFSTAGGLDTNGKAKTAALSLAAAHGYSGSHVIVNIPPLSGFFAAKKGYVEVLINTNPPRFFSKIFGDKELSVYGRSVAAGTLIPTKASVLVLDPKKKNALKLKGKGSSLTVGGDIIVNSKNKKAMEVDKKAQVKSDHVLVAGGLGKNSKRNIDAEVKTGVEPTLDPWQSLPTPPKGKVLDVKDYKTVVGENESYHLSPGTYKELKFDKNDQVTMEPGIYYVDGGGFELKGDSTLKATGVTIYNTGKRGFKISTKGDVTISPPTTGVYKGISLFQDSVNKTKVEFSKQFHLNISGVIYAPNSEVKFKKSDIDMVSGDDDDWELEEDVPMEEEFGQGEASTISAAIVAKKLSLDKNTNLTIIGTDISAYRPLLGVVE